jgi:tetratricopeptide (TPR) repeat protein
MSVAAMISMNVASGNYSQAIHYYDKALAIDPNLVLALTGKANVVFGLRNYTQAIPYLDKALAIGRNRRIPFVLNIHFLDFCVV